MPRDAEPQPVSARVGAAAVNVSGERTLRRAARDRLARDERPGLDGEDDARRREVRHPRRPALDGERQDPARPRRPEDEGRHGEDRGARAGVRQARGEGPRRRRDDEHGDLVHARRRRRRRRRWRGRPRSRSSARSARWASASSSRSSTSRCSTYSPRSTHRYRRQKNEGSSAPARRCWRALVTATQASARQACKPGDKWSTIGPPGHAQVHGKKYRTTRRELSSRLASLTSARSPATGSRSAHHGSVTEGGTGAAVRGNVPRDTVASQRKGQARARHKRARSPARLHGRRKGTGSFSCK